MGWFRNMRNRIKAIKKYAAFKDKDLHRLAAYAEKFRVSKILKQYMEVLL